ncbi:MAG: hypothetical protein ACOX0E_02760 [Syntrophomonadaceae bacterium]
METLNFDEVRDEMEIAGESRGRHDDCFRQCCCPSQVKIFIIARRTAMHNAACQEDLIQGAQETN